MKYWRGYLTAAVLGFFSWALMQFAKSHTGLVDMFYPYVTRMIQGSLAQWSGGTEELLWQLALVLFAVVVTASIVFMIVLKWNPIQWFGWVLAVGSVVLFLNTAVYGLNDYAGPMAEDIKLEMTDYTLPELKEAAIYYRERANTLANMVSRDSDGNVKFPSFDEMAEMTAEGFQTLTYQEHMPIFYGTSINNEDTTHWANWESLPIKELGWADYFTSIGTTAIYTPLTGEVAVNSQIPEVGLPFIMCRETAKRLCIANEGDAEFAAYLACSANPSLAFQYSAQLMAYRSCRDALASMPGSEAAEVLTALESGENDNLSHDLSQYDLFFEMNRDEDAVARVETVTTFIDDLWYNVRDILGVEKLSVETDSFYDLLVNWHIQEVVLPMQLPQEEEVKFDPYDEDFVNGLVDIDGNAIQETTGETEGE